MSFCPLPSSSGKSPANASATRSPRPRKRACGWAACRPWVVNDDEARIVVEIYRRYLALKSVHALRDELADAGIKSKRRTRPEGAAYGGQKFSRGALYLILQNRLYRGEIPHKGNSYPGEHPAIVERPLWDDVQVVLAANRVERATGARARPPSLLTGMVFDETGERLTPTYAVKKGTRYRYYVSTSLLAGAGRNRSSGRRIPAGNLEGLAINRTRTFLADLGFADAAHTSRILPVRSSCIRPCLFWWSLAWVGRSPRPCRSGSSRWRFAREGG